MNILVSCQMILEESVYKLTSFYATCAALEDVVNKNMFSSAEVEKRIIFLVFVQECRSY